jgi:branched-chain amino acid transport system substrate-binding protein
MVLPGGNVNALAHVAATIAVLFMCLGCPAHGEAAGDPVKIGVYLPLTGQNGFGGQLEMDGVRLAHQERPTVLGRPVELVFADTQSDKAETITVVKRLLERDNVVALIGTYGSSLAMAGADIAEKARIPGIGTTCTNPLVTQGRKYYFRACFIDPYQGAAAATYARDVLKAQTAAVLMDMSNDYSVGLSSFFVRSFKKQGGQILATLKYSSGDRDFTGQIAELKERKPDLVFMPAYFDEGIAIMRRAREMRADFMLMGADAMDNPDTARLAGKAAEGFLHTTFPYDPAMPSMNPEAKHFTEAWKRAYPDRETNVNGAQGYSTYLLLLDAITRAGSVEPDAIAQALATTSNLPSVMGALTINKSHDAEMPVGIITYTNGKRVYIGEVMPH